MDDELQKSYDQELSYLRRAGVEFARKNPKIAGRLRLGPEQIEDPHVSRLIESVAFLNSRIRRKVDDDYPELTDGLFGVLSPYFLAPVPSMSVLQFECAPDLLAPTVIERGRELETDSSYGEPCRYRTAYDVHALPVVVETASLQGPPFQGPSTPRSKSAGGLVHLVLKPAEPSASIGALGQTKLRFFLNGEFRHMALLYELLLNDVVEVAVSGSENDPSPQVLPSSSLQPVGFEDEENVLPDNSRSHPEQRLLTEYFCFPHKFLFVDIEGLDTSSLTNEMHVYLYLRRTIPDLELIVKADTFRLGCTPVVNLFKRKAEPLRLSGTTTEYHLIPDSRREVETEIYSVDAVHASTQTGNRVEYAPFYGVRHDLDPSGPARYWHSKRRSTPTGDEEMDRGSEIFLSLVDDGFVIDSPDDGVLETDVTCLNRNQPSRLPFGGGHPKMNFVEGGGAIIGIHCLAAPTSTTRPAREKGAMWRLVSLLSLHHASIVDGPEALQFLRECLRLFDPVAAPETRRLPAAILSVESSPVVRRIVAGGQSGFCRGLQVRLELDEELLRTTGLFLFASVMERFLAGFCTINSFIETVVSASTRDGELRRWAPRSGSRILL